MGKGWTTKDWMHVCAFTGVLSLQLLIVGIYLRSWPTIIAMSLITIRQIIVFPKWRKKLRKEKEALEKEVPNEDKPET